MNFEDLKGKTLTEIAGAVGDAVMTLKDSEGNTYSMFHEQDCCESVRIEDICGDLADLLGSPILSADESSNSDNPPENSDSFTWTFYKLATIKGSVTIRWLGESNGYYGESVTFQAGAQ